MVRLNSSILDQAALVRSNRTTPDGCIRLDRKLYKIGVGRIQISSRTTDPAKAEYRNALITRCVEESWIDTLIALRDGEISIQELEAAQQKGRLEHALEDARARRSRLASPCPLENQVNPATNTGPSDSRVASPAAIVSAAAPTPAPVAHVSSSLAAAVAVGLHPEFAMQQALGAITWPEETKPLWETLRTRMVPLSRSGPATRRRYATSLDSFRQRLPKFDPTGDAREILENLKLRHDDPSAPAPDYVKDAVRRFHDLAKDSATIGDLKHIRAEYWDALEMWWGRSPADWNHLRRALSATLTTLFGLPTHPFRRQVLQRIPTRWEPSRVPDLNPEKFWEAIFAMPEHARPGIITLVATGVRVSEYEKLGKERLKPNTFGIQLGKGKTPDSTETIYVARWLWPWIEAAVPAPLKHRWLGIYWKRACQQVGITNVTLHDLRHCLAQWAIDADCDERDVQWALRHRNPDMTRRYTRVRGRRNVARATGQVLSRSRRAAKVKVEGKTKRRSTADAPAAKRGKKAAASTRQKKGRSTATRNGRRR